MYNTGESNVRPKAFPELDSSVDWHDTASPAVKFRFPLRKGRLYSFWVSSGRIRTSYGDVAAGGPGFGSSIYLGGAAAEINRSG